MSNSSINIKGVQVCGNNIGTGYGVYSCVNPFNTLNFKSMVGAGNITISGNSEQLIISGDTSGAGEVNTASNIGVGLGLYSTKVGDDLRFKTIVGAGNVNISNLGTELQISGTSVAQAAGSVTQIQYNATTGNTLGASSGLTFSASTQSLTVGTRSSGTEGYRSFSHGYGNLASGYASHTAGLNNIASSCGSFSQGQNNCVSASNSAILGGCANNIDVGNVRAAIIGGNNINLTGTDYIDTTAVGNLAIITEPVVGSANQVLVRNTSTGKIEYVSGSTIGATDIYVSAGTLNGSAQLNLARSEGQSDVVIDLSALSGGTGGDGVVSGGTLNGSAQLILNRTESLPDVSIDLSALSGGTGGTTTNPAGSDTQIQYNDGGAFGANSEFTYSAATCSVSIGTRLAIGTGNRSVTIGTNAGACGNSSFSVGIATRAYGDFSSAFGCGSRAFGKNSFAVNASCAVGINSFSNGSASVAYGTNSSAFGNRTYAFGSSSHAGGQSIQGSTKSIYACGIASFNHSYINNLASIGCVGAHGDFSAILGGTEHYIESGNTSAAIIGGNQIRLTGTTYTGHTAVDNLVIWTPSNDTSSANLLTWNPTTRKVGYIAKTDGSITSDARLKKSIKPIEDINLDAICGVSFEYNELTPQAGSCAYGVIAQEIERVFPLAVKDKGIEHNGEFYKTVDYNQLTPILLNKIKELENKIKELENKI